MRLPLLLTVTCLTTVAGFIGAGRRAPAVPVKRGDEKLSEQPWRGVRVQCRMAKGNKGNGSVNTDNPYYSAMNAYQILGIERGADKKAVKSAYRKLVSIWHPDKFPDDEAKKKEGGLRMEKINRAYFCLEDDDRRRRYDLYGEKAVGTSASSEEKMKTNADAYFGDGGNSGSSSSSGSSNNSGSSSKNSGGRQGKAYRVEDDPFVWGKFRREQEEKRQKYDEERRKRDSEYDPEPQRQRSDDNSGEDWSDDWWKAERGGSSGYDGPRRPAYGSGSHSDYDDYASSYADTDQVPFPNAGSSYEDIMDFLQKTGGFGVPDSNGGAGGGDFATKRIYGDDASVDSPQLRILRNKKGVLLQEQLDIRNRLDDDGTDWGEVTDADAISQRLSDMSRVQTIDQEIGEIDDEIEDAVMRISAGEKAGGVGDGFSQRAWGSAVGADGGSPYSGNPIPSGSSSSKSSSTSDGSANDLWGFGNDDEPRRPRGVTAHRRTGARAGNVYGRAPPSRDPPSPPKPPSGTKGGDGSNSGDDDRKRPTVTSQGRTAKEENSVRQRRRRAAPDPTPRPGTSGGGSTAEERRRDLYAEPVEEESVDGYESFLGGDGAGGMEGGEDLREEGGGSRWRKDYEKRRKGGESAPEKSADEIFLEEIEKLQRKAPKGGAPPRGPRR